MYNYRRHSSPFFTVLSSGPDSVTSGKTVSLLCPKTHVTKSLTISAFTLRNHCYLNVLSYWIDVLKRIWLLENSCAFTLPVLSHVYGYIMLLSWQVCRPKGSNFTKSSFYKHSSYQIWTPRVEALLTKSPLSLVTTCSCSWSVANKFYLWFHSPVWACFIKSGASHNLKDHRPQKSQKIGYNSKADCTGSNNSLSTALGKFTFLLLKYLQSTSGVLSEGTGSLPAWLKDSFQEWRVIKKTMNPVTHLPSSLAVGQ